MSLDRVSLYEVRVALAELQLEAEPPKLRSQPETGNKQDVFISPIAFCLGLDPGHGNNYIFPLKR